MTTAKKARPETELAKGLRALANLIDANPELADAMYSHSASAYVQADVFLRLAKKVAPYTKRYTDSSMEISRILSGSETTYNGRVTLNIVTSREGVCVKKVVGTKTVEVPEVVATPATVKEVDIVEWDCHPLLSQD